MGDGSEQLTLISSRLLSTKTTARRPRDQTPRIRPDRRPEARPPTRSLLAESSALTASDGHGCGWAIIRPVSANLDLVRSIYERIESGDYSRADWAHPEIEYIVVDGPEPDSYMGLQGLANLMREHFTDIEDFRDEADEHRELDADRVVVFSRISGLGRRNGIHGDHKLTQVFEIHDGKVTRITVYIGSVRALSDLGLTPDTDT